MAKAKSGSSDGLISANKRARREFEILEKVEAGLVLTGSEVKSLRTYGATIGDAYAKFRGGEAWLVGAHIKPFENAGNFNHEPDRARKLLLHKREVKHLEESTTRKGLTVVPLRLYFSKRGFVKLQLGLGRGKKLHDKRADLKKRSAQREIDRAFKR